MSNLSNLYISESYYGVVNLYDSTQPFESQSEAKINFTDGVGESLGLSVTDTKDIVVDNNLIVSTSVEVLGTISGSVVGIGNVSQFSESVDFRLDQLETDTGSQDARIDQLEIFSQSQDLINQGYNTFTQSYYTEFANYSSSVSGGQYIQDQRLDSIESFTSSLTADFVTDLEYSASIAVVTGSLITQINTKLDSSWTSSVFVPFSSSVDSRITTNASNLTSVSASIATTDLNQQNQINSLISFSGSYATTGSNTFVGSNTFSGSVNGEVIDITIISSTASMDCSLGNFFTLNLPSGSTHITATNIKQGETVTLKLNQPSSGYGTITNSSVIKYPFGFSFQTTDAIYAIDVISFVSFDTESLLGTGINNLV